MHATCLFNAHVKRTTSTLDDELELPDELENAPDPDTEVEDDPAEEVEDEVEEDNTPPAPQEEMVPLSRLRAESARADALVGVLEQFRHNQPQPQRAAAPVQEEDPYQNYTPEAKQWIQFMAPVIQREARKIAQSEMSQVLPNVQREALVTRDMQDRQHMLSQHRDFGLYEQEINEERAKWYQNTGQLPPAREAFYYYVKGKRADSAATAQRSTATRVAAKAGSQVSTKVPAKKIAPKGPITLNDVANMSEKELEEAMIRNGVTF
jgi:hypothetical protein